MKVTWLANTKYIVDLDEDEKIDLDTYVVNLNEPAVTCIADLLALMISYLSEHCTDILQEPEIDASEHKST